MNRLLNIKGSLVIKLIVFFLLLFTFLFKFAETSQAASITVRDNVIGRVIFDITTNNQNEYLGSVVGIFDNSSCNGQPVWGAVELHNISTEPPWTAEARWGPPHPDLLFYVQLVRLGNGNTVLDQFSTCLAVRSAGTEPPNPLDRFSCDDIMLSPSDNLTSDREIEFTIIGFRGPAGNYSVDVYPTDDNNPNNTTLDLSLPAGNHVRGIINPQNTGSFKARLINDADPPTRGQPPCESEEFTIAGQDSVGESGHNPCRMTGYGQVCDTAVGVISTNITEFARTFLSIAIGIAGGIALILMVFGAVRVLTSSGNQQTLSAGRDTIIAAVAGLLFLIFSVIILRSIGLLVGIGF